MERLCDGGLVLAGAEIQAHEILRALDGVVLSEVDQIDRCPAGGHDLRHGLRERELGVFEGQRDGPIGGADDGGFRARDAGELGGEEIGLAHGGGHEQEARVAEGEQGDLPGAAAVAIRVIVELVHDHFGEGSSVPVTQGVIGEDFGGAAEDGGVAIYGGIPGGHADVLRSELLAEREEFFVDQGLDGTGVDRAAALGDGEEVHRRSH